MPSPSVKISSSGLKVVVADGRPAVTVKLGGIQGPPGGVPQTNLDTAYAAETFTITSDAGTDALVNAATATTAGAMSASAFAALEGVVADLAAHEAAIDPHPQYTTAAEAAAAAPVQSVAGMTGVVTLDSDDISNLSSATGGTVTAALNHIHNTKPTADNALVSGEVLIGAGDGHLQASGVPLASLATDAELSAGLAGKADTGHTHAGVYDPAGTAAAAIAAHEAAVNPHPGYATDADLTSGLAGKANASHTHVAADVTDFNSAARAQVEAELVAGTGITLTPSGSGASRQITIGSTATGSGSTNLAATYAAETFTVTSDTGSDATINAATATTAGAMSAASFVALDGAISDLAAHEANTSNPHGTTAAQVGADPTGSAAAAQAFAIQRTNHTGTQTLATISDAGTAAALNVPAAGDAASGEVVKGNDSRLTNARAPTAHTHPSTDISDSTAAGWALLTATDAAAQRQALGIKVFVADVWTPTAANPATNGLTAIDSRTPVAGEAWLLTASGVNNGLWIVSAGAWTRPADCDSGDEIRGSMFLAKQASGSGLGGQVFLNTNASAITIGVTSITFSPGVAYDTSGNMSIGRLGSATALGIALFANGGTTARASITAASGANGNLTIANTGTGSFILQQNGNTVATFSGTLTATATTLGLSTQTGVSVQVNGGQTSASGTPTQRISNAQSAGIKGLDIANTSSGTAAGKYAEMTFSGDATPFKGGGIRVNPTAAFAWNNASQLHEMIFNLSVGTTDTQVGKWAARGLLAPLRGMARNYARTSAATYTINASGIDNHIFFEVGACTVTFPASTAITDGQELVLVNNHSTSVTLTLTAGSGTTIANASETIAVGDCAEYKYIAAITKWVRVNAVSGSAAGGSDLTTTTNNAAFTATSGTAHLVTTGASDLAVTMPAAGANGALLGIVKADTGAGVVNVGSNTIHLCSQNDFVVFISTGSAWQILHRKIAARKVQFTSSGTWTKRPLLKWARVMVCNAGAGGGSGRRGATSTVRGGGSGGGGSPPVWQDYDAAALNATETVTIGSAGTGGAAQTVDSTNGNPGTLPGLSSFKNLAPGRGSPGAGGVATTVAGGAGASVKYLSNGIGVTGGAGGTGGQGNGGTAGGAGFSGGGGGGAGITSANTATQTGLAGGSGGCDGSGNATMATFDPSPAGGATTGAAGTSGADATGYMGTIGGSGGGGGCNGSSPSGTAGGDGGNGGFPGGGGGGGGGSTNGSNSGKGGDGGAAVCCIWEFYE